VGEPGFAVLKAIKEDPNLRNIAVIVVSSSLAESDIKRAVELHANAYLQKPTNWADVEKLFVTLESFWRLDARFAMPDVSFPYSGSDSALVQGLKAQLAQTACFQIYGISRARRR
jgi:CheY-like chemotaxis protein